MLMAVFVGHETALEFWRAYRVDPDGFDSVTPSRVVPSEGDRPSSKLIAYARSALHVPDGKPLHTCAFRREDRGNRADLREHVCGKLVRTPFCKVGRGLHVANPELAFLQAAVSMQPLQALRIGFELCGTYGFNDQEECVFSLAPLTSVGEIAKRYSSCSHLYGMKSIEGIVGKLLDGSASPYETDLAILLSLPSFYGGYNIHGFELNGEIDLPPGSFARWGKRTYRCDYLWRNEKVALEFESKSFHSPLGRTRDVIRENALNELGYTVISVTSDQLRYLASLDNVVASLRSALKTRGQITRKDAYERRLLLHSELFPGLKR